MTKQTIIDTIKTEMAEQLKYNSLDELSHSPYYVQHIMNRIGKIAFDADFELTYIEQDEILAAVFSE
jgi:hypothetical protein